MAVNEHFFEWLKALRSGEIEQGHGYLHRSYPNDDGTQTNQMCCLGVCSALHADNLGIEINRESIVVRYDNMASYPHKSVLEFMGIPDSHIEPKSLGYSVLVTLDENLMKDRIQDFGYLCDIGNGKISVDILNDNRFSFEEIAGLLEKEFAPSEKKD